MSDKKHIIIRAVVVVVCLAVTQEAEKANKVKGGREEKKETVTQEAEKENRVISRRVCSKETMTQMRKHLNRVNN